MTFQEFAATRLPALLAFTAVLTGQRTTAEDIAQEVLIRAHAKWDLIGSLENPDAYVRKMLLNEFLSARRRGWRLIPSAGTGESAGTAPDHAEVQAERAALLTEIAKLPRRQRSVIVLRYYEDLDDAEIAKLLGCRPATVRAHATRALAALRVEMRTQPAPLAGNAQREF